MKTRHVSRFLLALAVAVLALAAATPVSYAEGPAAAPTAVIPPASPLGKIKEGKGVHSILLRYRRGEDRVAV